jgi:choline dehydrogenase-like flavoprotein
VTGTEDNSDLADRPYRGARPYRSTDADIFFGREQESAELLRRLQEHRIVLLYGPAGSGRTSLIDAGLIPAARVAGLEPAHARLRPRSGEEVVLDEPGALVIADRFDDVVTLFTDRDSQARILEALTAHETLLLSFREEHLAEVLDLLGDRDADHFRLTPPEALHEIVRGPFARHPGRFEPELSGEVAATVVDALERRAGGAPVRPADLQLACLRLWEADEEPERLLRRHGISGVLADDSGSRREFPPARTSAWAEAEPLTRQERRLRWLLLAHAAWSAILAIGYIAGGDTKAFGFMPNSFSKDAMFVALSLLAAWNMRRLGWLALIVAAGYAGLIAGQASTLLWGGSPDYELLGVTIAATPALLGWMAIDLVLLVLFVAWWWSAVRSRWKLEYLNPIAFVALIALAEVLIEGRREVVPPQEIAHNVDSYLARLDARGKRRVQAALTALALWPLLSLRPPLPLLDPISRKRFLERRFITDVAQRRAFAPLRPLLQGMIRLGSQMSYLGYYGDSRSWPEIGYTPFKDRPGGRPPEPEDLPEPPLTSLTTPPRDGRADYDTIVVGSGAAGGILAYRFAQEGRRVLVLERGPHVDPRRFTDDEVDQYLRLYNAGALQLATDFRLQVLQGMCVGGGTTVNNALCLDPPPEVLDEWSKRGIDRAALERAIGEVRRLLPVGPIHENRTTSVAARRFADAAYRMRLPGRVELMEVNISERCLGCGYCNIGCAYGAKLSMLDTLLPLAQREHELDVLADFEVTRIVRNGDRATGVEGRYDGGEKLFIPAGSEVVIAAGALHSSTLLQRSGIGGDRPGNGLHFNINSPLTADFPEEVDAFAGIQMSHAYAPGGGIPGFLLETWFNPPATQALSMPGWFGDHFRNMLRYRHMAAGGALVGTTHPATVREKGGEPVITYEPSEADLDRLVEGLKVMGRIFLAAGALRVMPATYAWHEYRSPKELDDLHLHVKGNADILLTTAHPQGGNAIGEVVEPDFRVRDFANLYLCDASVFPTSVHVNPQLTVMGMAQLAASTILA